MENEKQNDVVEDLVITDEPTTEPASVPETLATEATPVVEEQPEVILEPVSVENNVEAPVVENNVVEGEVATNNEVVLEPVPSQAEVVLEPVPAVEGTPEVAPETPVVAETNPAEVPTETPVETPVEAPVEAPAVVESVNPTDVPATNMDVPNVNAGVGGDVTAPETVVTEGAAPAASTTEEKPKKKKTVLIVAIIIALVAIIAVVVLFVVKSSLNNPYKIFNTLVDKGYTEVSTTLKEADAKAFKYNFDDSIVIDGNIKVNSDLEEFKNYFAYDYGYKLGLDPKEEKVELGLSMNKDGQVTLDGFIYVIKNMMYIKSEKAYNKVLYLQNDESLFADIDFNELKTSFTVDDVNKLLELYLGYVKKAVKEDKFTTEKGTIKYNGEEIEVNKIKYELNANEQYEFANEVYESMKADNDFKSLYMKIFGYTQEEYAEELEYMKPEQDDYKEAETQTYYIYTKGFFPKVMGVGLTEGKSVMTLIGEDEKYELTVTDEETSLNATINGDVIEGSMKENNENTTFKLVVKETDKGVNAEINMSVSGEESFSIAVKVDSEKVNDKSMKTTASANVTMQMGIDTLTIGFDITNNINIGGEVANVDTTGAVDMNTLTEADYQLILDNIKKASVGTPLELLFMLLDEIEEQPYVNSNIVDLIKG